MPEAIKFAFQKERERIDLAKVTLPMSECPSWRGTIEEIYEELESELGNPDDLVYDNYDPYEELCAELRRRYAPKNDKYTIYFDEPATPEEDVVSIPPSCDTLIAMQK